MLGVVVGVILTVGIAEASLRVFDDRLPPRTNWPTVETDFKFQRLNELAEADVVFLGSSITEAAIDPVQLAQQSRVGSAFNSGLPFSTPFSNEWWLDEVVLGRLEPAIVVIGLTAWSGDLGPAHDPLLSAFEGAMAADGESSMALLENAGVLSEWDSRMTDAGARALLTDRGHQTGYYDRSIDDAPALQLPHGSAEMPQGEAETVGRMIDQLNQDGIEAIVLIEPGRYPGDDGTIDYERYIESVVTHEAEWGVTVVDTFHMDWKRDWFADLAHFNRRGTEEFTEFMARTIDGLWVDKSGKPGRSAADIP